MNQIRRISSRRLLATLTPNRTVSNPLIPPYAHTASPGPSVTRPALVPPYSHNLNQPVAPSRRLLAPLRFQVVRNDEPSAVQQWQAWAEQVLGNEQSRARIQAAWIESIQALEKAKGQGSQIPQIQYLEISSHVSSETTLQAIRDSGSFIIRDVIPDRVAIETARAVLEAIEQRSGYPVFWLQALLDIRSNPSILSSNSQVSQRLSGEEAKYIQANTITEGFTNTSYTSWTEDSNTTSTTRADLALTPATVSLPTTSHAATYATLYPLFRAAKSKISFYDSTSYLDPSNWKLLDPSELKNSYIPSHNSISAPKLPHIEGACIDISLSPGDILYRTQSQPVMSSSPASLALPITPLGENQIAQVQAQRKAFEIGIPPSHVLDSTNTDGETIALEEAGDVASLGSSAGKRAMGY